MAVVLSRKLVLKRTSSPKDLGDRSVRGREEGSERRTDQDLWHENEADVPGELSSIVW